MSGNKKKNKNKKEEEKKDGEYENKNKTASIPRKFHLKCFISISK